MWYYFGEWRRIFLRKTYASDLKNQRPSPSWRGEQAGEQEASRYQSPEPTENMTADRVSEYLLTDSINPRLITFVVFHIVQLHLKFLAVSQMN